jgi:hypothetical protein
MAAPAFQQTSPGEPSTNPPDAFRFTSDGRLEYPATYREWVFLSAGRGMTYGPSGNPNGPPLFDNVFVSPSAYRSFMATGHWPERAIFVLEIRNAASEGSINKGGQFQKEIAAIEVEVKDGRRFTTTNGWGFFEFDSGHKPATQLDKSETCYACHTANGGVEQTFVQFYPTLVDVATAHGTLKTNAGAHEARH